MAEEWMDYDLCAYCHSIVLLRDEVVGFHPDTGKEMRMHSGCATPEHHSIPIREWLHRRVIAESVDE